MDQVFETIDRLYRRHRAELLRYLIREGADPDEAEDAVQTAFLDAYRALLAGGAPDRPRPWLYAIARNAWRRRFRRLEAREPAAALDPRLPAHEPLPIRDLVDAVERLPEAQRAVLLLREVGGHSYAEIAEELDTTVAAVQMLLFRARRSLRADLEGEPRRRRLLLPLSGHQLPGWLSNAVDRLGPAGGTAAVLGSAVAATAVATGGAAAPAPEHAGATPQPLRVAARGIDSHRRLELHARLASAVVTRPAKTPTRPQPPAPAPAPQTATTTTSPAPPPPEPVPAQPDPRAPENDESAETVPVPHTVTVPTLPSEVPALPETPPPAGTTVPLPLTTPAAPIPDVTTPVVTVPRSTVPEVDLP